MKKYHLSIIFVLLLHGIAFAQDLSPKQIADKALKEFHSEIDPEKKLLILERAESELLNTVDAWDKINSSPSNKYLALNPRAMYDATYSAWFETYQKKKYRKLLVSLSSGNFEVLTKKNIKFINKYRRQTHFLRMSFNMFDENHIPPAGFKKFVVHSGRLKDLIALSKKSNFKKKTGKLQKKAQMLLELYDSVDLNEQARSIKFISNDDFKKYFKGLSDDIVEKLGRTSLSVEEFHGVRKKIKEIQFSLKNIIDNSPERADLKELFEMIDQVRSEMGDVHTMYINLKITKDIEYSKHQIKLADSYKKSVESLVKIGEKNICSVKFANFSTLIQ